MAMWVWKCNVQPAPASLVPEQKEKYKKDSIFN